jgi:hypothetical protein
MGIVWIEPRKSRLAVLRMTTEVRVNERFVGSLVLVSVLVALVGLVADLVGRCRLDPTS